MARQMKDSGIAWIGEIPEEWEVARLKQVFDFGKGLLITKDDLVDKGIPVISYGQIHAKSNTGVAVQQELIRYVPDIFCETNSDSFVSKNDFILADTSEDLLGCGNCVFVDREMELFAGYHTIILRSTTTQENKYLAYLFLTDAWRSQIRSKVSGVKLFSISRKILSEATVLVPPTDVKHRIAAYLDRRCAEIDAVMDRTKATIEEYKKLKQAVITEAVTKGVRGLRKMKDSGIEWIGEIPEEWHVVRGKNLFIETNDRSTTGSEELLTVSHITGITPRSQKNVNMFMSESLVDYKICCVNDIAANTMWMWQGAIGVSKYHGVVSPSYNVYRQTSNAFDPVYLDYLLRIENGYAPCKNCNP